MRMIWLIHEYQHVRFKELQGTERGKYIYLQGSITCLELRYGFHEIVVGMQLKSTIVLSKSNYDSKNNSINSTWNVISDLVDRIK